jgi:glycosyltransferase involved in cell wall biosynthesis
MRIAIITEQPATNGSSFYRALQHVERLRARGHVVETSSPTALVARPGPVGKAAFFGRHAVAYAARLPELRTVIGRADAVLVQRGLYPMGPAALTRAFSGFRGHVVYDLDDAVFLPSPTLRARGRAARWLYGPEQAKVLLERADAVVVSTAAVAELLPGRTPDVILPTVPDVRGYPTTRHTDAAGVRVGWVGSRGNLRYLDPLAPVFQDLSDRGVAQLTVIADAPWNGPGQFRQWRREDDPAMFGSFDIGIMPLPDEAYTRAKAGFKLLQYMAAGAAVVASPVGLNRELVTASGAGLLADSVADWSTALERLAGDPALRARMGAQGQTFMGGYADVDAQADVLVRLLSGGSSIER